MGPRGRQVVPCRPSDAIALLLRQHMPTPLLVAEWVFTDTGADHGSAH
jgi:bifunctional DNase/RNase